MHARRSHGGSEADRAAQGFGAQLRAFRLRVGLTQAELAERAGLATSAVGALEQGLRRRPYPHTLSTLAEALGLAPAERVALIEGIYERDVVVGLEDHAPDHEPPSNLPAPHGALIGRAEEIAGIAGLITARTTRLVTLTGAGGTGKTCLALEVGQRVQAAFAEGVWVVEVAPLADPTLVVRTIAAVVGMPEGRGGEPLARLVAYLRGKELLLILDNCEHLIDACAQLAERILAGAPGVGLLGTSREPLMIPGERQVRIRPLAAPELDACERLTAEDAARYAAVQLFVERGRAAAPSFRLDAQTAPAIGRVCSRLAGIPLALELAAARLRALTLAQLVDRLDDALQLLAGGSRTAPTRQQALRASLDWSYQLLPAAEQAVFRRLSVFAGGCELEAAETICAPDESSIGSNQAATLDLITGLVDKSLVVMDDTRQAAWYRLLETVRQYAQQQLAGQHEDHAAGRRHAGYYLELTELAAQQLRGPAQLVWLERLDRERANLRAALQWAQAAQEDETLVRLGVALVPFWEVRGDLVEGRGWLELALAADVPAVSVPRLGALLGAGRLAFWQADLDAALSYFEQSHALARQLDDRHGLADATTWLGTAHRRRLALGQAEQLLRHSLGLHEALGDRPGAAFALLNLAHIPINARDWARAKPLCEATLERSRALGDVRLTGMSCLTLGYVLSRLGEHERSVGLLREGLAGLRATGDRTYLLSCLLDVARELAGLGQSEPAARLLGAAEAVAEILGTTGLAPVNREDAEVALEAIRARIGPAQAAAAKTEGRRLTPDAALREAEVAIDLLARGQRPAAEPVPGVPGEGLTPREQEVVRLLGRGYSDRQIAASLGITKGTAAVHVHHVLGKLGVRSRWQAAAWSSATG